MLENGEVGALVHGIRGQLRRGPASTFMSLVGSPMVRVTGGDWQTLYMLAFPNRELLFLADTTVNIEPDAKSLAEISIQTAAFVRDLGIEPGSDGHVLKL